MFAEMVIHSNDPRRHVPGIHMLDLENQENIEEYAMVET